MSPEAEHSIRVMPAEAEPDLFDWTCSCPVRPKFYFGNFERAVGNAITHVPDDATVVITRPVAGAPS